MPTTAEQRLRPSRPARRGTQFERTSKKALLSQLDASSQMLAPGNIDLFTRPEWIDQSGEAPMTVYSSTFRFTEGGQPVYVVLPRVSREGEVLTSGQQEDRYLQTKKHLGKFKTAKAANDYSKQLSRESATRRFRQWGQTPQQTPRLVELLSKMDESIGKGLGARKIDRRPLQ